MDKLTSPESKRVTVISDIILTSRDGTLEESEVVDITFDDIDGGTQEESFNTPVGSRPFKNLFESPIEHVSKKRKQEFLLAKNEEKRIRFENEINKENENEEEEEEEEVEKEFNYMTGTYEPVKKPVAPKSDENNKTQSLHTSVKEICHVNENRAEADKLKLTY